MDVDSHLTVRVANWGNISISFGNNTGLSFCAQHVGTLNAQRGGLYDSEFGLPEVFNFQDKKLSFQLRNS